MSVVRVGWSGGCLNWKWDWTQAWNWLSLAFKTFLLRAQSQLVFRSVLLIIKNCVFWHALGLLINQILLLKCSFRFENVSIVCYITWYCVTYTQGQIRMKDINLWVRTSIFHKFSLSVCSPLFWYRISPSLHRSLNFFTLTPLGLFLNVRLKK